MLCLFDSARAKLDDQPSFALWKNGKIVDLGHTFLLYVVDQKIIEAFKADGFKFQNFRDVISRFINAWIAQNQEHSFGITEDEPDFGFQNRDAGALASHQGLCNVEAPILAGQQMVEVVTRNTARNLRISLLDQLAVFLAERFQPIIDKPFPRPPCAIFASSCSFIHPPDRHLRAVVKQDVHREDVLAGLACHLRVHAA